jgi:hypothetical protein
MFPYDGCLPLYTSKDDPLPVASRERRLMRQICCRCSRQQMADIVAKVENRRAIIFPPKDDVTDDRRPLYSQSR